MKYRRFASHRVGAQARSTMMPLKNWINIKDALPPEGVNVDCKTESHGEMDGVRRGDCIHVGFPDLAKPVVTHWRPKTD